MFAAALAAAAFPLVSCSPAAPPPEALPAAWLADSARVPDPLGVYHQLGFVVGNYDFPAVGRFVFLPGPGDSTYSIFAFSLPNSALRFRREQSAYLARYQVSILVGDSAAPVARLDQVEEVRVRSFRETARRDESVVFQGFLTTAPGVYQAAIQIRDLASHHGLQATARLAPPSFAASAATAPVLVYRAEPRSSRDAPPSLIINPRATVDLTGPGPLLYVERLDPAAGTALQLVEDGEVILVDSLPLDSAATFQAALDSIDPALLPVGALTLRLRGAAPTAADSATLLVAMAPDWVTRDYAAALSYLRYAGTFSQLDSLRSAPPGERARALHTFWSRRDPDPSTPENEFFEQYFRRIQDANDRFSGVAGPGWLTEPGAVYVTLGPPDEVTRPLDTQLGPAQSQVWQYRDPTGFELRLVFVDAQGTGEFRLSDDSRLAFQAAVQRLYY